MQAHDKRPRGSTKPSDASGRRSFRFGIPEILFSMKFAIWIAVILAVTSIAGVLVQEFYPVRNEHQAHQLSELLPAPLYGLFMALQMYDPFRAVWFRVLLGLLALSLLLCSMRNFRPNFTQAFRVRPLRDPRLFAHLPDSYRLNRVSADLFDTVVRGLRRRLFFGTVEDSAEQKVAAFHRGGIARAGPVLLHVGILVLVVGGLFSSLVGKRGMLIGSPGEILALGDSPYQLRIDRFDIDTNEMGQVKQYRSLVTVLDGDREVLQREIEVNKPLRFAGFNLYQSTYEADPSRAASMLIRVRPRLPQAEDPGHGNPGHVHTEDQPHTTAGLGEPIGVIDADMQGTFDVPGNPGFTFRARRFFAHLKITEQGPVNASRDMVNPAVELVVLQDGEPFAVQWAFGRFPAHAREELPFVLELVDARPVMATGLEMNTNPGAPLIWFGLILSTVALVLCFLIQHHTIYLIAQPTPKGWTLWLAGRATRERIAFSSAFERFAREVHRTAKRLKEAERTSESPATAAGQIENHAARDAETANR